MFSDVNSSLLDEPLWLHCEPLASMVNLYDAIARIHNSRVSLYDFSGNIYGPSANICIWVNLFFFRGSLKNSMVTLYDYKMRLYVTAESTPSTPEYCMSLRPKGEHLRLEG